MAAQHSHEDDPLFWKLRNVKPTYWDEYIVTRPLYDSRLFDLVFDHHTSPFDASLDIETGSSSALPALAERFTRVIATDNDPKSLKFAQMFRKDTRRQTTVHALSNEELSQHFPPETFDVLTCAETYPLVEIDKACANILSILHSGGIFKVRIICTTIFRRTRMQRVMSKNPEPPQLNAQAILIITEKIFRVLLLGILGKLGSL